MDPDRLIRWIHDHDVRIFLIGLAMIFVADILGF
jgi:hypothetical protein